MVETKPNGKNELLRLGWTVFILLAALTVGEYFIGSIAVGWIAPLFLIALVKAGLIVRDYMHISRLFAGDEEAAG